MVQMRLAKLADRELVFEFFKQLTLFHLDGFQNILKLKPYELKRTIDKVDEYLKGENSGIIIAESEGEAIGVLGYYIQNYGKLSNFDYDKYLLIDRVIVPEHLRGQNIGQFLVKEAERLALEMGIERVELELGEFNEKAGNFYDRLGYKCYMRCLGKDLK